MATNRRFTADDIREILLSDEANVDLARRFGISREGIRHIRSGRSYSDLCPDIERVPTRAFTCHHCIHWVDGGGLKAGHCTLGIPESYEPGHGQHYARLCATFIRTEAPDHAPIAGVPA